MAFASTKEKRFQYNTADKIENLIHCLGNYKAQMEYKNIDFNTDKVKKYEAVREDMARIYEEKPTFFGLPVITPMPAPVDQVNEGEIAEIQKRQKIDKKLIKKGYICVQEKLKEIRQNFASAVTSGSRSGSGKIILEYFDQLKQIWGGSPSTEPLSCGVGTDDFTDSNENESTLHTQLESDDADVEELARSSSSHSQRDNMLSSEGESPSGSDGKKSCEGKKGPLPILSFKLLINEFQFKKDTAEAIQQCNKTLAQSMLQAAQGFTHLIEVLVRPMVNKPSQPQYQYPP